MPLVDQKIAKSELIADAQDFEKRDKFRALLDFRSQLLTQAILHDNVDSKTIRNEKLELVFIQDNNKVPQLVKEVLKDEASSFFFGTNVTF